MSFWIVLMMLANSGNAVVMGPEVYGNKDSCQWRIHELRAQLRHHDDSFKCFRLKVFENYE